MNDDRVRVYRNEDVRRIVAFIPQDHKHIRIMIETENEVMVFQEATVAGLIRAYINIKLHPMRNAIELKRTRLEKRKSEYASYQLLEEEKDESSILEEMSHILNF